MKNHNLIEISILEYNKHIPYYAPLDAEIDNKYFKCFKCKICDAVFEQCIRYEQDLQEIPYEELSAPYGYGQYEKFFDLSCNEVIIRSIIK